MFVMLRRTAKGAELRDLYELVGDTEAVAKLDREQMGQTGGIQLSEMGVAGG